MSEEKTITNNPVELYSAIKLTSRFERTMPHEGPKPGCLIKPMCPLNSTESSMSVECKIKFTTQE